MAKERAVAFVVARLSSSRLPAKQMREIGGRSILSRIFDTLKTCRELDAAVLATVSEPENAPLRDFAEKNGIPLFWYEGDVNHVTTRLKLAAETFGADICLLISADCPLLHGPSIDELTARMRSAPEADAMTLPPGPGDAHCLLEGVHIGRLRAWRKADGISDRPELKEHQFPALYRRPDLFRIIPVTLTAPVYGPRHRMSVDTWADLEFMETLSTRLEAAGRPFTLPEAVALMEREPALKDINSHVHQRALVEDVKKVLIACDAGGPFGYGHFMRMRELAGQLTERASWPVTLLIDDAKAAEMAENCGFRVKWGAFGRTAVLPPGDREIRDAAEAMEGFDLVAIDISARRNMPGGWRRKLPESRVIVIDRGDAFALEADLVIFPGVTGRPVLEGVKWAGGPDHLILRREIRRYQGLGIKKDLDLLAYFQDPAETARLRSLADGNGLSFFDASGFGDDFPKLLASARVFVSGYGQSFYEALALGAVPVARPLSPLHEADARAFYDAYGLMPFIIGGREGLGAVMAAREAEITVTPVDGTPNIVEKIRSLAKDIKPACR